MEPRSGVPWGNLSAVEVQMPPPDGCSPMLTAGELRALSLSAHGLTVSGVAEDMGTSAGQVRMLLASAITRLGAGSKLEAIILAARRGDIELSP